MPFSGWFRTTMKPCILCSKETGPSNPHAQSSHSIPVRHPQALAVLRQLCSSCRQSIPWIAVPVCRTCGRPEACPDCRRRSGRHFAFCRSAVRYDERMKSLLALYKYRGSERLEPLMAAMCACALERIWNELPEPADGSPLFHIVTSVPLAPERLEDRGFNQAEGVAQMLADWYRIPCRPLLQRMRHTEKQSLKNRRSRLADMRGNFSAVPDLAELSGAPGFSAMSVRNAVPPASVRKPIRVLLVDDVYTTGSTVNECAGAIKTALSASCRIDPANLEIYGVLWARS